MVFHCLRAHSLRSLSRLRLRVKVCVMYSDDGGGVAMAVVTFYVDCMELRRFLKIYFKTASCSLARAQIRARFAYINMVCVCVHSILVKKIGEATHSNFVCMS